MSNRLTPERFKQAEFARVTFSATVPEGVTFEEVLEPAFWAHVAAFLVPRTRIEIWSDTGSWYGEVVVLSHSRTHAKVAKLLYREFAEKDVVEGEADAEFDIAWKGAVKKYCVIRKSDKEIVKDGCDDKLAASKWLLEYQQSQLA